MTQIISEYCNLEQKKYKDKTRLVGEGDPHWQLCRKFQFHYMNKWYMHNPESLLENETHKVLWDFETQTDHLITPDHQT